MIDAHVHIWEPGQHGYVWPGSLIPELDRVFSICDWEATSPSAMRAVLVQSQPVVADTDWLLQQSTHDRIAGVVGWSNLLASEADAVVEELSQHPSLIGLRPMVQDEPADWFDQSALDRPLAAMAKAGLTLDALVRPLHLPALARLARRHSDLRIVLDHGGKPAIGGDTASWEQSMQDLAQSPNVFVKLSGLVTEAAHAQHAGIETAATFIVALFGADRVLWGSDWPVLLTQCDYATWFELTGQLVSQEQHPEIFERTAYRAYQKLRAP